MYKTIKVYYRKNLKMSVGKVAAQVGHAVHYLAYQLPDYYSNNIGKQKVTKPEDTSIIVLGVTDKKFNEKIFALEKVLNKNAPYTVVQDLGKTEVEPGTETCVAWYE